MYNFYQSDIWKNINQNLYHKPVGEISLFGKTYQYVLWEKKKFGLSINRIQILGIEGLSDHTYKEWKHELQPLKKKHKPLFIQLGAVDIISTNTYRQLQDDENRVIESRKLREEATKKLVEQGFKPAVKENLPPSTYVVDLKSDWNEKISGKHMTKITKARKKLVHCKVAEDADIEPFFALLKLTGKQKKFNTIGHTSYENLMQWCIENKRGVLYVAKLGNDVIAGAVYIVDGENKTAVYLYGATDRTHHNIGASQFLHHYIFGDLQWKGIEHIDMLGGGPTGYPEHPLTQVSVFKEGFGGLKCDYIGSFDIIYDTLGYHLWKLLRLLHH